MYISYDEYGRREYRCVSAPGVPADPMPCSVALIVSYIFYLVGVGGKGDITNFRCDAM